MSLYQLGSTEERSFGIRLRLAPNSSGHYGNVLVDEAEDIIEDIII